MPPRRASASRPPLRTASTAPATRPPHRTASTADRRAVERLRAICLALPGAAERPSHGEPTWFTGQGKGKVFAMLDDHHHRAPHLSVWLPLPLGAQEALVGAAPERFFRPPYVGPSGWVGVVLDAAPDWPEVARLVREAHQHVAPGRTAARGRTRARLPPAER